MGASVAQKSGGGRRRAGSSRTMSEINVTPFVDVMLCLLIIFMVAAPLMTVGVPMDLPDVAADPLSADQETTLTINMTADGKFFLQRTEIQFQEWEMDFDQIVTHLTAVAAERNSTQIYLRGDTNANYGRALQIMGALESAGYQSVNFVSDPEAQGPTLDDPLSLDTGD